MPTPLEIAQANLDRTQAEIALFTEYTDKLKALGDSNKLDAAGNEEPKVTKLRNALLDKLEKLNKQYQGVLLEKNYARDLASSNTTNFLSTILLLLQPLKTNVNSLMRQITEETNKQAARLAQGQEVEQIAPPVPPSQIAATLLQDALKEIELQKQAERIAQKAARVAQEVASAPKTSEQEEKQPQPPITQAFLVDSAKVWEKSASTIEVNETAEVDQITALTQAKTDQSEKELIQQKAERTVLYPTRTTETIIAEREAMFKAIAQGSLLPAGAALTVQKDRRGQLVQQANTALTPKDGNVDYDTAIRNLDRARDAARGIDSKWIAADKANGQPMAIYLSDARNAVSAADEKDTFENWASMGLSYFRIAEKMIEIEISKLEQRFPGKDNEAIRTQLITALQSTRSIVQQGAKDFLTGIQQEVEGRTRDDARHTAKHYMFDAVSNTLTTFLADTLAKARNTENPGQLPKEDKKAAKQRRKTMRNEMAVLRDFGSLEREPFSQVTINNALGQTSDSGIYTTRIDVPLYDLTSAQKYEFDKISRQNNLASDETLPEWYTQQPEIVRDMIAAYSNDILAGRDLPSQMYQYIPAIRNAAEIRCYSNTLGNQKEYFRDYRSGNIGCDIRSGIESKEGFVLGKYKAPAIAATEAVQKATQDSIEQFQHLTGADTLVLNSLVDITSFRQVNDRNKAAAQSVVDEGKAAIAYGNMAVNKERYAQGVLTAPRDMAAANEVCDLMDRVMAHAKKTGTFNPESQRIIVQLAWVREEYEQLLANISMFDFRDAENANAHLTAKVEQMTSLIRQYYQITEDKTELANLASTAFCKSGKDRAGIVQIIAQSEIEAKSAILDELILSETKKEFYADLVNKFAHAEETLIDSTNPADDLIQSYIRRIKDAAEKIRENAFLLNTKNEPIEAKQYETIIQQTTPVLKSLQKKQETLQNLMNEAVAIENELTDIVNKKSTVEKRYNAMLNPADEAELNELSEQLEARQNELYEKQSEIDDFVASDFVEETATIWKKIANELGYETDKVNWHNVFNADGTTPSDDNDILMHLANAVKNPEKFPLSDENKVILKQCLNNIAIKQISTVTQEKTALSQIAENVQARSASKKSVIEQVCPTDSNRKRYADFIQQSAANQITGGHNGRISANQSVGSESIKNDGDIIPPSLVAEDPTLINQLTRETADYNNKMLKPKEIDTAGLKNRFSILKSIATPVAESIHEEADANLRESFQINNRQDSQDKSVPKQNFIMQFLKAAYVAIVNFANNLIGGNKNKYDRVSTTDRDSERNAQRMSIGRDDTRSQLRNDTQSKGNYAVITTHDEEDMQLSERKTIVTNHHSFHGGSNVDDMLLAGLRHRDDHILNVQELLKQKDELIAAHHLASENIEHLQHTADLEADSQAENEALLSEITIVNQLKEVHDQLDKILHAKHPEDHKEQIVQVIYDHNEKLKKEHGHNDSSPLLFKHETIKNAVGTPKTIAEMPERMSEISDRSSFRASGG